MAFLKSIPMERARSTTTFYPTPPPLPELCWVGAHLLASNAGWIAKRGKSGPLKSFPRRFCASERKRSAGALPQRREMGPVEVGAGEGASARCSEPSAPTNADWRI